MMRVLTQLEYIKKQLEIEIEQYSSRKRFNRQAALAYTIVPASLAAFATVAIGATEKLGIPWLPLLAMIATGIASVIGAWEALFANRKLWVVNNVALTGLYEIKSDIEYRELEPSVPIASSEVDEFFARLKLVRREGETAYLNAVHRG